MELNNLIIENQNMIYKITHYFEKYASKEDLFQVGCIGLIKAYKKYDVSYGAKFTTYAYPYILGEIRKYVREDKGLKISREISKLNLKIEKATILLTQKLMREPSVQEISNYLEIPEYYVVESLKSLNTIESIDRPINDDSSKEITLKDTISSKKEVELKRKAEKIASKVKRRAQNPHASLKGKIMFYIFRKMQSSPDAAWNPKDRDWWIEQGWIENVRPWK